MVRVRLFNVVLCLAPLLVEKVFEITCREGNDAGRVLLDDSLRVVFQYVWEFIWDHDLLCTVNPLLSNVSHVLAWLLFCV